MTYSDVDTGMKDLATLKSMHDLLMSDQFKPSGADELHVASLCPLCDDSVDGAEAHDVNPISGGGDMSNKTHEDELHELKASLDAALAELAEVKASQEQAAIEARIAELNEAHEAAIAELQAQLDTATAKAEAEAAKHDELVAFLEGEAARAEAEAALAARREEVAAAVAGIFPDEHIEANLDRWASLEAEAFEALVADWQAVRSAAEDKTDSEEETPVASTAMKAERETEVGTPDVAEIRRSLHVQRREMRTVGSISSR